MPPDSRAPTAGQMQPDPNAERIWDAAAEIRQRLSLHAVRPQAIRISMEIVPTLPDDVISDQVSAVHRNALKLAVPPSAGLLEQVMNVQPEHCRRLEQPDDIHSRNSV
jgi:hypothetical protein